MSVSETIVVRAGNHSSFKHHVRLHSSAGSNDYVLFDYGMYLLTTGALTVVVRYATNLPDTDPIGDSTPQMHI